MAMTHLELTKRAKRWLKNTVRCGVVLVEHSGLGDVPDAIGYKRHQSILVECKTSRADFYADLKKPSRASYEVRPAFHCYYLCEPDVIPIEKLPRGWGLLHADPRWIRTIVTAEPDVDDRTLGQMCHELSRLYLELRRYQAQGIRYETVNDPSKRRTELELA